MSADKSETATIAPAGMVYCIYAGDDVIEVGTELNQARLAAQREAARLGEDCEIRLYPQDPSADGYENTLVETAPFIWYSIRDGDFSRDYYTLEAARIEAAEYERTTGRPMDVYRHNGADDEGEEVQA
jgi:hypothetical protein